MISKKIFFLAAVARLAIAGLAIGQTEPTTQPAQPTPGYSLTIYSSADPANFDPADYARQETLNNFYALQNPLPGYGIVRDNRQMTLDGGDTTVRFTDVATGIDPTTVSFRSLTAPDAASVLEQNYEYDLVSADKLLGKYLDKKIRILRRGHQPDGLNDMIRGTLLSFDAGNLVVQDESGQVKIVARGKDIDSIELAKPDSGLITKPTLVWKIHNTQPGDHLTQVTYQTSGLTWRADYNITLTPDDTAADIGAWVTILNQSGVAYPDAHLKLVAGDVQRIRPRRAFLARSMVMDEAKTLKDDEGGFVEKSFFEYHLYTLGRRATLNNNSTKQIELFDPKLSVPVEKKFVYYGNPRATYWIAPNPDTDRILGTATNKKVDVYVILHNKEKDGLGIPLPAGRIRVYKKDEADGSKEFIGEDTIQHTPKDEDVQIKLGSEFDIVGEHKQTHFHVSNSGNSMTESFEIKIRNHKKEPVRVIIKENLYRWNNWEIISSSDPWEKQDYRTIHFPVDVPVDGEKVVTYTVRYTW